MDRGILLMALLPLSVFCFDIYNFFSTDPPPNSSIPLVYHHSNTTNLNQKIAACLNQAKATRKNITELASMNETQIANLNQTYNDTILIKFSSQCSYRGTAISIKFLVMQNFPSINVTLSLHPPDRPKYIASKLISTAQVLIIMIVMAGNHILLELKRPVPSWYYRLTAHKFYVVIIPWLLGCITINYLQNTEDFQLFFNDNLVFCKQQVGRFPGANEMKEIICSQLAG